MRQRNKQGVKVHQVASRIEEELYQDLRKSAFDQNISMAKIIEDAIKQYINGTEKGVSITYQEGC